MLSARQTIIKSDKEEIIIDTKQKTLLDIFIQCRRESIDILNDLMTGKIIQGASGQIIEIQTQIDNSDLEGMVKKTYKEFVNKYNKIKWNKRFIGETNDVYAVFMSELITLIQDKLFVPDSQEQLCKTLKYNAIKQIHKSLMRNKKESKPPCSSVQDKDKNDELVEINPSDKQAYDKWLNDKYGSQKSGYIGIFRELLKIDVDDFKDMLPTDAKFQKSLINLFEKPYSMTTRNESFVLKPLKEIAILLKCDGYSKVAIDVQVTKAINKLYDCLMECAVGYVECSHKDYKKVKSYSVKSIHKILSEETEKDIEKACKYNIVDINYYKAYDSLVKRVDETVKLLTEQGFAPDREKILDIALFEYNNNIYWNICKGKNNKYKLEYYNNLDNGLYDPRRSKKTEFTSLPECYTIGNCVIYADKDNKRLIYLQKESRLIAMVKRGNKYTGYKIA